MNPIIGLVLASVLVVGITAVVMPSLANAEEASAWCFEPTDGADILCKNTKEECKDASDAFPSASKCFKFEKTEHFYK